MQNIKTAYQAMRARSPELYKDFCRPTAYACFSELDLSREALPLAACGGERQAVNLGPKLRETHRKPKRQRDNQLEKPFPISPAVALRL
jgi:hypothetical protein